MKIFSQHACGDCRYRAWSKRASVPVALVVALFASCLASGTAPAAPAGPGAGGATGTSPGGSITASTTGTAKTTNASTTTASTTTASTATAGISLRAGPSVGTTPASGSGTRVSGGVGTVTSVSFPSAAGGRTNPGTATKGHKPRPAPVQVLNPGTPRLIQSLRANEQEITELGAYGAALSDLLRAQAVEKRDKVQLAKDVAAWQVATVKEVLAVKVEREAASTVALYEQALYELGIAEYTGQTAMEGSGLQAAQHQLVVVQYGEVAAGDTTHGLDRAQKALALAKEKLALARVLVGFTRARAQRAKQAFVLAEAQLSVSGHALLEARTWVLVPSAAPLRPLLALVVLEKVTRTSLVGPAFPEADHLSVAHGRLPVGTSERAAPSAPSGAARATTTTTTTTTPTTTTTVPTTTTTSVAGKPAAAGPTRPALNAAQLFQEGPTILGTPLLSTKQIEAWFERTGASAVTEVPIGNLIKDYLREGEVTGVRSDIAFAQSIVETGYFSFPAFGQDPFTYNNFAGIGACDTCKHGFRYSSPMAGVAAQQQLLREYALPYEQPTSFAIFGVAGSSQTWMALSGTWATNINYGYEILSVYNQMLLFVISTELQQFGLARSAAAILASATTASASAGSATAASATAVSTTADSRTTPSVAPAASSANRTS